MKDLEINPDYLEPLLRYHSQEIGLSTPQLPIKNNFMVGVY